MPDHLQAAKGKCAFAGSPASGKREVRFCRITCKRQKGSALLPDHLQAPKGECAFAGLPASAKREVHFWRITCKRQKGSVLLPDYLKAPKWKGWVKEIGFSFMFNRLCLKGISPPLMRLRHRRQSAAVCRRGFCGLLIPRHSRMRHILILQLKNLLHMGLLLVG